MTPRQCDAFGGRLMMSLTDEKQPEPDEDQVVFCSSILTSLVGASFNWQ
jgi:hypothetical protein